MYYSVGGIPNAPRTFVAPANTSYLIASFYIPTYIGYLMINNILYVGINEHFLEQSKFISDNNYNFSFLFYGNGVIDITSETVTIPKNTRIAYGRNLYYKTEEAVVLTRGDGNQVDVICFAPEDGSFYITATPLYENLDSKYIPLFSINHHNNCTLPITMYTINGVSLISSNNDHNIVTSNAYKESNLISTVVYKGLSNIKTDNKLSILHLTDIHGNQTNLSRIITYFNNYSDYIDYSIHTGDTVASVITDTNPFEVVTGGEKILNVAGNHEAWLTTSDNDYLATEKEVYDKVFINNISNWDVVQPENAEIDGKCYYYKDTRNFRMIAIDTVHWHTGGNRNITDDATVQREWFESVLNDAIANDMIVVCSLHYPPVNGIDIIQNIGGFNPYDSTDVETVIIGDGWCA